MTNAIKIHSFTTNYDGMANVLQSRIGVSIGFNPAKTSVQPTPKTFTAVWDTGATHSAITNKVVNECGLKPISMARVHHADGVSTKPVYLVNIYLPNKVNFFHVRATEGDLTGCDVLIGMDVINTGDFAVTNLDGKTTFSFRFPSVERIDFVKQYPADATPVSSTGPLPLGSATPAKKIGRNDPCQCGSGKKYKKCCGT
ncbi:hypothetical protein BMS3Abin10_00558 [bacterium BMS3Abin10]|nr:hypothetical protein BMS3Abin10_00558 [bacterium BMS3Abin10]